MSRPWVSIVVPTFNSESFVGRMIESVETQTFEDWELIIVDGTSSDGTAQRVADYRDRIGDRLVFIQQPNQGCNAARNAGIEASRGAFVAFLDSDDAFLPTKLERQLELFDLRPDLGMVFCDYSHIDLAGVFHRSTFDTEMRPIRDVPVEEVAPGLCVCAANFFEHLIRGYFVATITGMVRRDVLADDIRFYVDNWYGVCEWMFYLEITRRCRVGFVDEPLCVNHFIPYSISRTSRIRNSIDHRNLLHTIRRRFPDCSPAAAAALRDQLADTCRQLGLHGYKYDEYGPAVRYFAESLRERPDLRTAAYLMQSALRWILRRGRPGREPRLRTAAGSTSTSDAAGLIPAARVEPACTVPSQPASL